MANPTHANRAVVVALIFALIGPVVLIVAAGIGGDFFDGFAGGGHQNTQLEDSLFTVGVWLSLIGTVCSILVGVQALVRCVYSVGYRVALMLIGLVFAPCSLVGAIIIAYSIDYYRSPWA